MELRLFLAFALLTFNFHLLHSSALQTDMRLETPEDLQNYGFECTVKDASGETCEMKAAASAADLPSYFPARFRNLEWSQGSYMFYAEGSETGSEFWLESRAAAVRDVKVKVVNSSTYYHEVRDGFGVYIGESPPYWWAPAHDAEFKGEWLTEGKSLFQGVGSSVIIKMINNKLGEFSVFRSIHILLDPTPQHVDEIREPSDFQRLGFVFAESDTQILNVTNASQLPDYFPEEYRNLTVAFGERLMWAEVDLSFPERRHMFEYHPNFPPTQPINSRAVVLVESVGRRSNPGGGQVFGYGLHRNWNGGCCFYTDFPWLQFDESGLAQGDVLRYITDFTIASNTDGVGLWANNNHGNKVSVFKYIRFSYYWWPREVPATTTTTTSTTTTTPRTTTTTASTTTPTTSTSTTTSTTTKSTTTSTTTTVPTTSRTTTTTESSSCTLSMTVTLWSLIALPIIHYK